MSNSVFIFQEKTDTHKQFIQYLIDCGYSVKTIPLDNNIYSLLSEFNPDIAILDITDENDSAVEILANLRGKTTIPLIVLAENCTEYFLAQALDNGADDFLKYPINNIELLARLRTALRHSSLQNSLNNSSSTTIYKCGNLVIDYDKHKVTVRGKEIHLTLNEYKILTLLGKNPGKILTYDYIIKEVWGEDSKTDNLILRVNISNLRKKIEQYPNSPKYLYTQVGIGYKLAEEETMH